MDRNYAPCPECETPSNRIREGQETDWYKCPSCGKEFGITWQPM